MNLTQEIRESLLKAGASAVGFADLQGLPKECRENYTVGIVIAVSYSAEAIRQNREGNPALYYEEYKATNCQLPVLAVGTADDLVSRGYHALAKVQSTIEEDENYRTVLPYKTVATLAGIGWIGKCALLVTEPFGSALRLMVVLTNAPLECGTPIVQSKCPESCTACRDICPGHSISGKLWNVGVDRDTFFDAQACRSAARARAKALLEIDETICGLCIAHCPLTMAAMNSAT